MKLLIKLEMGNDNLFKKGIIDKTVYNVNKDFLNTLWDKVIESSISQF